MNQEEIQKWKAIIMKDQITKPELKTLEKLVAEGRLDLADFEDLQKFSDQINADILVEPSPGIDQKFYTMLGAEQAKLERRNRWKRWYFSLPVPFQWAMPFIILGIGFGIGWWSSSSPSPQNGMIASQSQTENLMITLLNEGSTSDRLKAVSMTRDMSQVSNKVSNILLYTLNHDKNANVRIASIEALVPFANSPSVRKELIESIRNQTSPLVILSLTEALHAIGESNALDDLPSLFNDALPPETRRALESSMQIIM
jgi:hypothetical protein